MARVMLFGWNRVPRRGVAIVAEKRCNYMSARYTETLYGDEKGYATHHCAMTSVIYYSFRCAYYAHFFHS